jgi:hypothetical protein
MEHVGLKICLLIGTVIAAPILGFGFTLPPGSARALCVVFAVAIEIIAVLSDQLLKIKKKCHKLKKQVDKVTENRDALKVRLSEVKQEKDDLKNANFLLRTSIITFAGLPKAKQQVYAERFIEQTLFKNNGRNEHEARLPGDSNY